MILQEIKNGLKYRYPICCVLFYAFIWFPLRYENTDRYYNLLCKYSSNRNYISCPLCLLYHILKEKLK